MCEDQVLGVRAAVVLVLLVGARGRVLRRELVVAESGGSGGAVAQVGAVCVDAGGGR